MPLQSLLAAVQETASEMMADTQAITQQYTRQLEEADRMHKAVQTQVCTGHLTVLLHCWQFISLAGSGQQYRLIQKKCLVSLVSAG